MTWTVRLAKAAEKHLKKIPPDRQEMILAHIREMCENPFHGDVKPLRGKHWKGRYRKRAGRYRLIFTLSYSRQAFEISQIFLRA
jgi:mRNA-degrading endonuclease RelE of RelBE toxin-antitoxin system